MLEAIDQWRPDLLMREEAEFGSYVAAEAREVPQVRIAISMLDFADYGLALATPALDELRASVALSGDPEGNQIRQTPVFTLVPPSLEDPSAPGTPQAFRFRSRSEQGAAPLPDWWSGRDDPLVYVTFGSVAGTIPMFATVLPAVVEALADLPLRLLVTVGEGFDPAGLASAPANVRVERWVPQGDVLPRADAIVCHGGFGTVMGALAHGVPLVVVPLFADQPANARRVAAIGAGLAVEGGPSLDMGVVRDSLSRVLSDPSYRTAAERVAAEMQALPPVDEAVEALVRIAGA